MKKGQKLWTREELILAINLYWKLEFGKIHKGNPEVIKLANLLGRSTGAIVYKLGNFGSFDPSLKERGVRGLQNSSKLDEEIWNEFYGNMDEASFESEKLRAHFENTSVEKLNNVLENDLPKDGIERMRMVKTRVNQNFFRRAILASYKNTCCITGINCPDLLVAGHIIPWSIDEGNRMNPRNGICINPLHDRAFELGYITIDTNYKVQVSKKITDLLSKSASQDFFASYNGKPILLP